MSEVFCGFGVRGADIYYDTSLQPEFCAKLLPYTLLTE